MPPTVPLPEDELSAAAARMAAEEGEAADVVVVELRDKPHGEPPPSTKVCPSSPLCRPQFVDHRWNGGQKRRLKLQLPSLDELRVAVPTECFKKNLGRSLVYFFWDLLLLVVLFRSVGYFELLGLAGLLVWFVRSFALMVLSGIS